MHYAYAINNGDIIDILKATTIKQNSEDSVSIISKTTARVCLDEIY